MTLEQSKTETKMPIRKKDNATKIFMSRKDIFADAVNFRVFGGREIVHPEDLQEVDGEELLHLGRGRDRLWMERYRDVFKCVAMRDGSGMKYLLVGVENQSRIDLSMPARCLVYDAMRIARNIHQLAMAHEKTKSKEEVEKSTVRRDFLSGLSAEDRLTPVITLVIYWGSDKWTGPRSLHEMMDFPNDTVRQMCTNYNLNLIEPAAMAAEEFGRLRSDLKQVLHYVQLQDDAEALTELLQYDKGFTLLSDDAYRVINEVTGLDFEIASGEEVHNMCKGIDTIKQRAFDAGEQKGRAEGREEGREEGWRKAITRVVTALKEQKQSADQICQVLVNAFSLSETEAAEYAKSTGVPG